MTDFAGTASDRWRELAPDIAIDELRTGIRFSQFTRKRAQHIADALAPFGPEGVRNMEDFRLLALITRLDPETTTATRASRLLRISKAATAIRLERFQSDGLVSRTVPDHDRRVVNAEITTKGRYVTLRCAAVIAEVHERLFAGLTSTQLGELETLMKVLD